MPLKRGSTIGWLAGLTLIGLVMLSPLSFHPGSRLADDGDSLQNLWILWWGSTHLELGYPEIFAANGYYPHPDGLLYSEPQIATAMWSSPLFRALDNRVLVFNLVGFLGLVSAAFCVFLLCRELLGSAVAALPAGAYYGFNAYHLAHLPQSQLVQAQWIPLGLLLLHRFFDQPSWKRGLGVGLVSLLVGLSSFYYVLFYAYAVVVLVFCHWWRTGRTLGWPGAVQLAVAGLASASLFAPVALPYVELFARYEYGGSPENFDLAGFFVPPGGSLFRPFTDTLDGSYFLGFISVAVAGLGAFAAFSGRTRVPRVLWAGWAIVGITAFGFAAGPDLLVGGRWLSDGPFRWLQWLPAFENLRVPARFAVLVYLSIAVFLAAGIDLLVKKFPRRALPIALASVTLLMAEHRSPQRTAGVAIPTGDEIPEAYTWLSRHPPAGSLIELPVWPFHRIRYTSLEAYFSTIHERPIPFGKPSFYPPALELLQWELRDFPDPRSLALLEGIGIELALVHPKRWEEQRRHFERMLARSTGVEPLRAFDSPSGPEWERYRVGGEELYLLTGDGFETTPVECDCIAIDRSGWRLDASGSSAPELAVDANRRTAWSTGEMQEEGLFFEITFERPRRPVRVEIEMAFPYGEFARNLEMNGYRGARAERVEQIEDFAYKVQLVRQLVEDPTKARLRFDLKPMTMERLRLFIHRTEPGTIGWSIPEIHVYESASPPAN